MKSAFSPRLSRMTFTALAVALVVTPAACAADSRTSDSRPPAAPLQLSIDAAPIDRNAPSRVSYAPMVEKIAESMAFVYSTRTVRAQNLPQVDDPVLRQFFGPGIRGGRVPEQTQRGLGSGIVISANGYILTNNHVIEGADEVKVSIGESNRRYDATVVGTDPLADVAVLRIKAEGLVAATFSDSSQLKVGDMVFAIGNPFGVGQSVSRGIVSALSRGPGIEAVEDFIQTDAAINPGNSGGALLDSAGRVVGVNTAILSRGGGFAGVGFAIPINLARRSAEQIVSSGRVTRGFLGVAPQELDPALADQFQRSQGALVAEVTSGSPAEKAGLTAGDIITKVNDTEIRDARHLLLTVSQIAPNTEVNVEYLRDGKTATARPRLTGRPEQNLASNERRRGPGQQNDEGVLNGVGVADITAPVRDQLEIPSRVQGAVITSIDPNSPAARQGLQEGDVILGLNQRPVRDAEEAVRLSEEIKGPKVVARVWREGQSRFVVIDESAK